MENPDLLNIEIDFNNNIISDLLNINLSIINNNLYMNSYVKYGSQKQFGKGYRRLYDWFNLFQYNIIYLTNGENLEIKKLKYLKNHDKTCYYFCFAGLIILFQVFSDGNHRTAKEYYFKMTNKEIDSKQMDKINHLLSRFDYYVFRTNEYKTYEMINSILEDLVKIYS